MGFTAEFLPLKNLAANFDSFGLNSKCNGVKLAVLFCSKNDQKLKCLYIPCTHNSVPTITGPWGVQLLKDL